MNFLIIELLIKAVVVIKNKNKICNTALNVVLEGFEKIYFSIQKKV